MRVFITGGSGFVGSNLIEYLIDKNCEVGYCDNSFSSQDGSSLSGATKECNDISEVNNKILSKYDTLIHLAAVKKHNALTEADERLLYDTNIINTVKLFETAGAAGINNIIFSSSLYANGNLKKLLAKECDNVEPLTLYGQSKLFGEFSLNEVSKKYNLNATAFRLYFIYGPKQYTGKGYPSVFLRTFERLRLGQSPVIVNDGLQRLDYMYVSDLCNLIYAAIQNPATGFNIFNASSSNAYSIKSVVEMISAAWNSKFGTKHMPVYSGNDFTANTYRSGDNSKARSSWPWTPSVNLETGISQMLDWYLDSQE